MTGKLLGRLATIAAMVLALGPVAAQDSAEARDSGAAPAYHLPPEEVIAIVDAPPAPTVSLSPDGARMLLAHRPALPSIEDVAQPMLRLAGTRIQPVRNERYTTRWLTRLQLQEIDSGKVTDVGLPSESRLSNPSWSPDGKLISVTRSVDDGVELWVVETSNGKARRLIGPRLNTISRGSVRWRSGSSSLLVALVPEDRGAAPQAPSVPSGPTVSETSGRAAKNRTYQDLLGNAHDEALFEHYFTAQLAAVDLSGKTKNLGSPGIFVGAEASPDGKHLLVQRVRRPYSYVVPVYRFARDLEVWDSQGGLLETLARLAVADAVPIGGVATGPRSVEWLPTAEAELVWVEALDGGDPKAPAEYRDVMRRLSAPFDGASQEIGRIKHRFRGATWTATPGVGLVTEYDRDRRWLTTTLRDLSAPDGGSRVLFDRSMRDVYGDPGRPVEQLLPHGGRVARIEGRKIFLAGRGAGPEGERPFLDRFDLDTLESERLFHSPLERYETFEGFVGKPKRGRGKIVVSTESPTEPPNYELRTLGGGESRKLTSFPDPHPQLTGIHKELVTYSRPDGVPLSGTLYLPPGYQKGTRLPLVMWAYPVEYNDARTAGQVRSTTNRFTRLRGTSPLLFLTQGYAVLDRAAVPVVGDPETMNDNFAEQIVAAAQAAIDKMDELGVADPDRVGVGGHSYGAFMTANLLAHSNLFRAGIARSGAYNRSLTPFGFQSERRTVWEATDVYVAISPFFQADRLKEPILLIHGEIDNNSGTFPIQSRRLFHALQGLGGTARLVLLPSESHGYAARESVLHVLAESFDWFDRFVKNAPPRSP